MRLALACTAALAALAVSACQPAGGATPPAGGETTPPADPAPSAPIEPKLNGVDLTQDLRVIGTEPFWSIDITNDYLTLKRPEKADEQSQNGGPTMTPGVATWDTAVGDNTRLKVVLTGVNCSDGMSDREYPLTAEVDFGDEHFKGCATTVAALDAPPHP